MDKSHVGMTVCMVCGEGVDILLDKQLRDRIPSRVAATEPCGKCEADIEGYKKIGIVLLVINDTHTPGDGTTPWQHFHSLSVVTEEYANKVFLNVDLSKRALFIAYPLADKLGILAAAKEGAGEKVDS